ncbi:MULTISPECIES: RHS repeat protein [Vibrio]|uniref:RHS repeat protein n=2 Tax=Vibrio TaxID=662 RepID=A0A2N7NGQ5_9VIBR|nr:MULTISPECIES: RHS repeat protein [Vibrio]PMO56432.1 hypothetical protein BCT08_10330 [Vibrio splendidus]PMO80459.1 hypothetical protein BCT01_01545 [Vibrio tasmaniensis]PMP13553.1 hypothetical protein BCS92_17160 [Vibrio tasmaniensis]TKG27133.1 RHS repeat protein [Vibrio tasmaniensis]TKG37891.1 RHS repeat protein [Vibrio tasmaniensis]
MSFLSNAHNFSIINNSGVDPRTGAYICSIRLADFLSHKTVGSPISLVLNYRAESVRDEGFGRGWLLSLSRFEKEDSIIYLSSGQNYKAIYNHQTNEYKLPYRKIKDIKLLYSLSNNEINVIYKSGIVESIDYETGALKKITSIQGLETTFHYRESDQTSKLWKITDGSGRELRIDYWSEDLKTTVTQVVGGETYQTLVVDKESNGIYKRLTTLHLPDDESNITFEYEYLSNINYDLLTVFSHPSGLKEILTYQNEGHSFPSGGPVSKVPYVTMHRFVAGNNQPDRVTNYTYSDKNYLGFASEAAFVNGEDTLFKSRSDYEYSSVEKINSTQSITRSYNKYHLQKSIEYRHNEVLYRKEEYVYYAEINTSIEHQPANYSFLKEKHETHYEDSDSRTFVHKYQYDDYGNQTLIREINGDQTKRVYYTSSGEGQACPPEPNGFVAFLQEETFQPASSITSHEQERKSVFTYQSLPRIGGGNFVVLKHEESSLSRVDYVYFNNVEELTHGQLQKTSTFINDFVSRKDLSYRYTDQDVEITSALTTHDNLVVTTQVKHDLKSGEAVQWVDSEGVISSCRYDLLGRRTREIKAEGTDYEAVVKYVYRVGDGLNQLKSIEPTGIQSVEDYNNAGKVIKTKRSDLNGQLIVLSELSYNSLGQLIEQQEFDNFSTSSSMVTNYEYDARGNLSKITHPEGRVEVIKQNPVKMTINYSIQGLLSEIRSFDLMGNLLTKELLNSHGKRLAFFQNTYDALGNLVSSTDQKSHTVEYTYDTADRVVSTRQIYDGETLEISKKYVRYSHDLLPVETSVNNKTIGIRVYDGLSRMVSEVSSSGTEKQSFSGASPIPTRVVMADGNELEITYNKYLKKATAYNVSGNEALNVTYHYDAKSGHLVRAENKNLISAYVYFKDGMTREEMAFFPNTSVRLFSFEQYHLSGRLDFKHDYFGNVVRYSYDRYGRMFYIEYIKQDSNNESVHTFSTLNYDHYSRLVGCDTYRGNDHLQIKLELNDVGLETKRSVHLNSQLQFSLQQVYNDELQISLKTLERDNKTTVEKMSYDDFHRLVDYQCDGFEHPKDTFGNKIIRQQYSYDLYGNITKLITFFSDGTDNICTYTYDTDDVVRLASISNTHISYSESANLTYDTSGNITKDERGALYHYDALGQLNSTSLPINNKSYQFEYDAQGRVVAQIGQDEPKMELYYQGDQIVNELYDGWHTCYHNVGGLWTDRTISSYLKFNISPSNYDTSVHLAEHQYLLGNAQHSAIATLTSHHGDDTISTEYKMYTPYGQG